MSAEVVQLRDKREGPKGTHDECLAAEMENQRRIYRPGTAESLIKRAAINALLDKGEW